MGRHPGIEERRRPGGTTYRARVRRGGAVVSRTFTTLSAALAWRAEAMEGIVDRGSPPAPPPPPPRRVATVADAGGGLEGLGMVGLLACAVTVGRALVAFGYSCRSENRTV